LSRTTSSAIAPAYADAQVFLANSGAEAIKNAVRLARAARPDATFVLTFSGAYHGLTAMALSLTPTADYQDLFRPLVPDVVTMPYGDAEALREVIGELGAARIVAIIVEPIQGEAGVIRPPEGFLEAVRRIGAATGILTIADEIQTGLGRTGHWFESLAQGLHADIITLAKPLGGGLIPIGVTIARAGLADRAVGGLGCGRLASTFAGNSLAAAIAVKSLELIVAGELAERARRLGAVGLGRLQAIQARFPELLTAVRGAGLLFALQFAPVVPAGWPGSQSEVVGELSSILGLHLLHQAGVQACLALNDKRTVRLTPALDMPEELFTELWWRVEQAAAAS
jgi:acetylornithine/succinyldiaminopimelate/putrescine aminotransferase